MVYIVSGVIIILKDSLYKFLNDIMKVTRKRDVKESLSIMLSMIALNVAKSSLSNKGISIELTQVAACTVSVVSEIVTPCSSRGGAQH